MTVRELAAALAALPADQQDVRVALFREDPTAIRWEQVERIRQFTMSDGPAIILDVAAAR